MKIILSTLNSTYQHSAFGLRYLFANLKELQTSAEVMEFTINGKIETIAQKIIDGRPRILGLGVYIWNVRETEKLIKIIKHQAPDICIVLGGPEVSHEIESQSILAICDFVIQGEADFMFYEFCKFYLESGPSFENWCAGRRIIGKVISSPLPDIFKIQSPYSYYSDHDIKNRVIYVEASRGCAFKCEYCLSSLDTSVRAFDLSAFLLDLKYLFKRGVRRFKFVDRTFNLNLKSSLAILEFFLEHMTSDLFIHFEMVPDRLPTEIRSLLKQFPEGRIQLEIGIQTWNEDVSNRIKRRNNYPKIIENLNFLLNDTSVHIHADLIAGLPGETFESFGRGFDKLFGLTYPSDIQVGVLKRLRGTPIARHDQEWGMVYQVDAPYQVIETKTMSQSEIGEICYFSRFWELYGNTDRFHSFISCLVQRKNSWKGFQCLDTAFFDIFLAFVEFWLKTDPKTMGYGISLIQQLEVAFQFLVEVLDMSTIEATETLNLDFTKFNRKNSQALPSFLK